MTKQEVGSLAFKLLGVYALVRAAEHLRTLVMWVHSIATLVGMEEGFQAGASEVWASLFVVLPFAALVALGVFLLARSSRLSTRMFPDADGDVAVTASIRDVQAIAFSVVGVLLFALALPQLAQIGVNLYYHWKFPEMNLKLLRGNWITLLTMCAKIILGTALFFGGRSLSNLWFRMRNFRQPPHADGSSARES